MNENQWYSYWLRLILSGKFYGTETKGCMVQRLKDVYTSDMYGI